MSPRADDGLEDCHGNQALLLAYARGEVDEGASMALEVHIIRCAACRADLARFADTGRLQRNLDGVLDAINLPSRGVLEALLMKARVTETTARLVAATPTLRISWFAAVTVALGFAVVAGNQSDNGILLFLVVAPLLPLVGVAAAYGPGVDPTYEIGLAAPLSSFRLLLLRVAVVLGVTTVLAGLAGLALPGLEWTAAAWLLPALGLSLGSVALSTLIPPMRAACLVGLGWLVAVVVVTASASRPFALFRPPGQIAFALLAVVAGLVIAHGQKAFEEGRAQ